MMSGGLPVTVVGGFLGAGKTTLVNHLLRHASRRYAVVVNDFGSVNIDAGLIAGSDGDVLSLANGCICCGAGPDLGDSLARLLARETRPEHVVVEASGVSDPWRIAQMVKLDPALRLDAVVVLVDAAAFPGQLADRYLADTLERQIARADLVVLNKCDVAGAALEGTRAAVRRLRPDARMAEVAQAAVPEELLVGPGERVGERVGERAAGGRFWAEAPSHGFRSWTWRQGGAFDAGRLGAVLDGLPASVLRVKGGCRVGAAGRPHVLQMAGRRWSLEPAVVPDSADVLVAVGTPALPDDGWLEAAFRGALLPGGDWLLDVA